MLEHEWKDGSSWRRADASAESRELSALCRLKDRKRETCARVQNPGVDNHHGRQTNPFGTSCTPPGEDLARTDCGNSRRPDLGTRLARWCEARREATAVARSGGRSRTCAASGRSGYTFPPALRMGLSGALFSLAAQSHPQRRDRRVAPTTLSPSFALIEFDVGDGLDADLPCRMRRGVGGRAGWRTRRGDGRRFGHLADVGEDLLD